MSTKRCSRAARWNTSSDQGSQCSSGGAAARGHTEKNTNKVNNIRRSMSGLPLPLRAGRPSGCAAGNACSPACATSQEDTADAGIGIASRKELAGDFVMLAAVQDIVDD